MPASSSVPSGAPERDQNPRRKDIWDRIDVLGKLISGVLLGVIALLVNSASQRISDSLKTAQLSQTYIDTILKGDSHLKRDIALLALDESIGNEQPQLVCRICEHILRDTAASPGPLPPGGQTPVKDPFSTVAFDILKSRCRARADALASPTVARSQVVSSPDPKGPAPAVRPEAQFQRVIARAVRNVVYIQYRDDWTRTDKLKDLHDRLDAAGFYAPHKDEKIGRNLAFRSNIRYFYDEDRDAATSVAQMIKDVLGVDYPVTAVTGTRFQPPRGQIEVWCSPVK